MSLQARDKKFDIVVLHIFDSYSGQATKIVHNSMCNFSINTLTLKKQVEIV